MSCVDPKWLCCKEVAGTFQYLHFLEPAFAWFQHVAILCLHSQWDVRHLNRQEAGAQFEVVSFSWHAVRPRRRVVLTPSSYSDIPLSTRIATFVKKLGATWEWCCGHICVGKAICKWPACWSSIRGPATITTHEEERLWETRILFSGWARLTVPKISALLHQSTNAMLSY